MTPKLINGWRTFVFSTARNRQRLEKTLEHLQSNGISAEPFLGFDCNITGVDHTAWTYDLDRGPNSNYHIGSQLINIQLSYHSLFRVFSYLTDDAWLILEDDVRFTPGWEASLESSISHLPLDWHLFFLGSCCCKHRSDTKPLGGGVFRVKYALCLHAFVVRKSSLNILLEHMEKVWAPADIALATHCMPHLNCYAILPRIATQNGQGIPE